jgi:hypothetical protein
LAGRGLIKDIFVTKKRNSAGIYAVRLWVHGELKIVVVDDYLPSFDGESPIFCRSKRKGEFWMCLLEKAWAKMHASYNGIIDGFVT